MRGGGGDIAEAKHRKCGYLILVVLLKMCFLQFLCISYMKSDKFLLFFLTVSYICKEYIVVHFDKFRSILCVFAYFKIPCDYCVPLYNSYTFHKNTH